MLEKDDDLDLYAKDWEDEEIEQERIKREADAERNLEQKLDERNKN